MGRHKGELLLKVMTLLVSCVPQMAKKSCPYGDVHVLLLNDRKADRRNERLYDDVHNLTV